MLLVIPSPIATVKSESQSRGKGKAVAFIATTSWQLQLSNSVYGATLPVVVDGVTSPGR